MNAPSFCAFCLRTRLSHMKLHKQVAGCSAEQRQCFALILGYDFQLECFAVCRPCWKLMELLQDFRLRCLKANNLVERISRGMLPGIYEDDGWFSDNTWAKIESFRAVIQQQIVQIEKMEVTAGEFDCNGDLEATEEYDEIKIEPVEIQDEVVESNLECEQTLQSNSVLEFESSVDSNLTSCNLCEATFTEHKQLITHLVLHSRAQNLVTCRVKCAKTFSSKSHRLRHEKTCAKVYRKCPLCEEQLDLGQELLYEHYSLVHPAELKHPCTKCDKRFLNQDQLNSHEKVAHAEGRIDVPCPECGIMFAEAKDLIVHTKRIHSELWLFQCDQCGKRHRDKQSLATHMAEDHAKLAPEVAVPPAMVRMCERKANPKRAMDKES
ncbi:hypothetical protein pipiens_018572, partial [Culex pipiens pipiens]